MISPYHFQARGEAGLSSGLAWAYSTLSTIPLGSCSSNPQLSTKASSFEFMWLPLPLKH